MIRKGKEKEKGVEMEMEMEKEVKMGRDDQKVKAVYDEEKDRWDEKEEEQHEQLELVVLQREL